MTVRLLSHTGNEQEKAVIGFLNPETFNIDGTEGIVAIRYRNVTTPVSMRARGKSEKSMRTCIINLLTEVRS